MNLEGRDCVVIGSADDREAIEKTRALEEAGANVRWIRDVDSLRDEDVTTAFFVISTPLDEALSARLRDLADRHHFLLCCIDQPAYGFVAMQAIAKAGPARITVSTGGVSPAVSKRWRIAIQHALDAKFARFLDALRARRNENRALADSEARKAAGREAAEGFDVQISVRYPEWFE
ncbi:MAG TPA: NAD(P)-dependent oxidoreductase [Candidatus Acidoferrales bacterium]|nr:NAD(P)-dependent oxidoreductase [Candidatus Acidoferrales bacterium]